MLCAIAKSLDVVAATGVRSDASPTLEMDELDRH
jgi:hypothetical protein